MSNFEFLKEKNINIELYQKILSVESSISLDFSEGILNDFRKAMEIFISHVIETHHLEEKYSEFIKMRHITESVSAGFSFLVEENILPKGQSISMRLPYYEKYTSDGKRINKKCRDVYEFIRIIGNSASHANTQSSKAMKRLAINYNNVTLAIYGFHEVLKRYYQEDHVFSDHDMPLGKYTVIKEMTPTDSALSKCKREMIASFQTGSGKFKMMRYAIIRKYLKKDLDPIFIQRNIDTTNVLLQKMDEDEVLKNIAQTVELNSIEQEENEFYYIGYLFKKEPKILGKDTLQNVPMEDRILLCKKIAKALAFLHSHDIYHRFLSYKSIYMTTGENRKMVPWITKFDSAKIMNMQGGVAEKDSTYTIFDTLSNSKNQIKDITIKKYIPNMWGREDTEKAWERVDIFSLGVLMADILNGSIGQSIVIPDDISDELAELLDDMTTERLDIQMEEVIKRLEEM